MTLNFYQRYITLFTLIFLVLCLEPAVMLGNAETFDMVVPLARFLILCLALSIGCLWVATKVSRSIFLLTLSMLLTGSLMSLKAAYHPAISGLSPELFIFVSLVVWAVIYLGANFLFRLRKQPNLSAFFWVFLIGISSPAFLLIHPSSSAKNIDNQITQALVFKEKPNIYLLSYDSLIPTTVAQQYLNLETIPYQQVIDQEFNEFGNSLTFHVASRPSLNDVMRLGQKQNELNFRSFSGNAPSQLSSIMSLNRYELITGYKGLHFGRAGPHIDKGLFPTTTQIEASVQCISQSKMERAQAFLICEIARRLATENLAPIYEKLFGNTLTEDRQNWQDLMLERIYLNSQKKQPVFTYLYTYNPIGHTSLTYDHRDQSQRLEYRAYFEKNAAVLARQISDLLKQIREFDPNSILIIFGDHGAFLSRNVKFHEDPEFFTKDRHRIVIAAAKTQHPCSDPKNLEYSKSFQTPSRILTAVFLCLSKKTHGQLKTLDFDENLEILNPAIRPVSQ